MAEQWDYARFCRREWPFYSNTPIGVAHTALSVKSTPHDWQVLKNSEWETWVAPLAPVRTHGWKIHVGATLKNAAEVLGVVQHLCVGQHVTFKFVPNIGKLHERNSKGGDRSGSGKFVTIYPHSDDQLELLAEFLDARLTSFSSPYVLSDVRLRTGPVYFRYGSFIRMSIRDDSDTDILAVPGLDGLLHPDIREPRFIPPSAEVSIPKIVQNAIAAFERTDGTALDEYSSIEPLHFSNGGGVYVAQRGSVATRSILKEARPHSGLDRQGRDAVERLRVEASYLRTLSKTGTAPELLREFKAWEHYFIEVSLIKGQTLQSWATTNYPFSRLGTRNAHHERYLASALVIIKNLVTSLETVQENGVVLGDVHPGNIMVRDDLSVVFIDFADSRDIKSDRSTSMYVIGFAAPSGTPPHEADWYALARSVAAMFVIDVLIELLAPSHWDHVLERITIEFGEQPTKLIRSILAKTVTVPSGDLEFRPATDVRPWQRAGTARDQRAETARDLRDKLISAVENARERIPGICYPGDIAQFESIGAWNILSGMSGVLLPILRAGQAVTSRTRTQLATLIRYADLSNCGLLTGSSGLLALCNELKLTEERRIVHRSILGGFGQMKSSNLASGMAGVGLALLADGLHQQTDRALDDAISIADKLASRLFDDPAEWADEVLQRRPGLFYGYSGPALFFLAVANINPGRRDRCLSLAREAIVRDLKHVQEYAEGALGVKDRMRLLPYLSWGSSGILFAITLLRREKGYSDVFEEYFGGLILACSSDIYAFQGFHNGRAGQIAVLAAIGTTDANKEATRQIDLVQENLLSWEGMPYVPGEQYLRLSTDFGTENAGLIGALNSHIDEPLSWLPVVNSSALFKATIGKRVKKGGCNTCVASLICRPEVLQLLALSAAVTGVGSDAREIAH